MSETDKIVAAIFTLGICRDKQKRIADYLPVYQECLEAIQTAGKEKKQPLKISDEALRWSKRKK